MKIHLDQKGALLPTLITPLLNDGPRAISALIDLGVPPAAVTVCLLLLCAAVPLFAAATLLRRWTKAQAVHALSQAMENTGAIRALPRRRTRRIRRRALSRPPRRRS